MPIIKKITARQILDSRGIPTLETTIILDNNLHSSSSVPSGASTGAHEAVELRDGDKNYFFGKSVLKAAAKVNNNINSLLQGIDVSQQKKIDTLLIEADGSADKSNFGANAILSVSLSCARLASRNNNLPLYQYLRQLYSGKFNSQEVRPIFNVINAGLHASGSVSFQEFFLIPKNKNFADSLQTGCQLYQQLKKELLVLGKNTSVGDEGGFAPRFENNDQVIDLLIKVIGDADVTLGLDVAANTFYKKGFYLPEDIRLSSDNYLDFIFRLSHKYNLEILEDPLAEDSWADWVNITARIGSKTKIIGDDLLVTNPHRLKKAIDIKAANGILVKLNQIGTLSETLEVVRMARDAKFTVIISHRSGETTDDFIADLAVAVGADYVKFGAPARGERVAKYNRLLAIYQNNL